MFARYSHVIAAVTCTDFLELSCHRVVRGTSVHGYLCALIVSRIIDRDPSINSLITKLVQGFLRDRYKKIVMVAFNYLSRCNLLVKATENDVKHNVRRIDIGCVEFIFCE